MPGSVLQKKIRPNVWGCATIQSSSRVILFAMETRPRSVGLGSPAKIPVRASSTWNAMKASAGNRPTEWGEVVQFKIFSRFHLRPGLSPTRSLSTSTTMMDQRSRTMLLLLRRGKEILHWLALLRCSQAAPQFDLGCQSPRPYTSNIFCPTKDQCTCYIQYSPCRSVFF